MCLERILRNTAFAIAALVIVTALGLTIEYLPLVSALER
jgi:hypothetical protein